MINPETLLIRLKQVYLIRGVINLSFGALSILLPNLTVVFLISLFGFNSLVVGLVAFRASLANRIHGHSGLFYLLEAVVAIFLGALSLVYPQIVTAIMVYLVAIWSLCIGSLKISSAISYKGRLSGVIWLSIAGWVYFLVGLYIISNPANGVIAAITILGIASIFSGISLLILSKKLTTIKQVQILIDKNQ